MNKILLLTLLLLLSLASFAAAQIPQTMSYQGVLTNADGNPVADGTVLLTFKLYDVATDGTALWEETQSLEITNGIFNAILGSVTTLNLPFDKQYWLGITLDQEAEMTPRIALTASPYSLGATATVTEPEKGQGFVVRNANGDMTHSLAANGDVVHTGTGTLAGIRVAAQDTGITVVSTNGPAIVAISGEVPQDSTVLLLKKSNDLLGAIFGKSNSNAPGIEGKSKGGSGVHGESTNGPGVRAHSSNGVGVSATSTNHVAGDFSSTNKAGIKVSGKPAGDFRGNVQVIGEIFAESMHIVDFEFVLGDEFVVLDSLVNFNSDGTVEFKNEVKLSGADAKLIFPDGSIQTSAAASANSFEGVLVNKPLILKNATGDTVFSVATDGKSVHKGHETFLDGITLTDANGGPGMFIEQRSIAIFDENGGGSAALNGDSGFHFFKPVMVQDTLTIKDANGKVVTMFAPDGTSLHTGQETFLGGIKLTDVNDGPGMLIEQRTILMFDKNGGIGGVWSGDTGFESFKPLMVRDTLTIKDANGNIVTMFAPDGTSLHTGDETFEGDVILKGTNGDGIKLVDTAGNTLAGFGRIDLDTGQNIGVFGKAQNPGDLAAVFEGPVDVLGEITASSLHIVNTAGDSLTDFFADGTSRHRGLETYEAGIKIVNSDGSTAIDLKPNTDPNTQYALTVNGNVEIKGILMATSKDFKIDHPLDPENKYLLHTSIESPDMKNVYDGVVALDENGEAVVEMPEWFQALNGDFRYQLTCIGGFAQVYVAEEIHDNQFKIAGGAPGLKVSWQVTGIRHDAWAKEHQRPLEGYKHQR